MQKIKNKPKGAFRSAEMKKLRETTVIRENNIIPSRGRVILNKARKWQEIIERELWAHNSQE